MTNLWKVAAKEGGAVENIPKTLSSRISRQSLENAPAKYQNLRFAWGSKAEHKNLIPDDADDSEGKPKLRSGDYCVFYTRYKGDPDKDGVYGYIAKLADDPVYDSELSQALWGTRDFPVIYTLDEPIEINLPTETFGTIIDPMGDLYRGPVQGLQRFSELTLAKCLNVAPEIASEFAINLLLDHLDLHKAGGELNSQIESALSLTNQAKALIEQDVLKQSSPKENGPSSGGANVNENRSRNSRRAKLIGDHCENLIVEYLRLGKLDANPDSVKLVASEKKGWDIEYETRDGVLRYLEIKGTTLADMENFELTRQELEKAEVHGNNYWCVLVSDCLTKKPKFEILEDPYQMLKNNEAAVEPIRFRFLRQKKL